MYLVINKCVTAVKVSNFTGHYLRNRSTLVFWVISVYFSIRNTLPKSGTFLLGHPVYIYIYIHARVCVTTAPAEALNQILRNVLLYEYSAQFYLLKFASTFKVC